MDSGFPVDIKQIESVIQGTNTQVLALGYSNYIVLIVSQHNNIGSLIKLTLETDKKRLYSNRALLFSEDEELESPEDSVSELLPHSTVFSEQLREENNSMENSLKRPILLALSIKLPSNLTNNSIDNDDEISESRNIINSVTEMVSQCRIW
ncbi:hypothetical protein BB560_001785 [Smittium megazygosporum]|uniref:Proteasome assembly chaperone 3 n=1 Tax=Smittium megazygosporum TaxID=133381 RepID=A0A2T9Y4N2_9FUNG|nr:hypothetical protein BB560_006532 [Smittium megazygosporum]PVV03711.1 hypothetical protein BB560_001785 [Smittium megazygosporum]